MSCDIFIFAGEPSGDLHGEKLLEALYEKNPELKISGVGGPRMRSVGMETVMPMENFQVMGFIDVFGALPRLFRQFYAVRRAILQMQPKAVVTIDYPGFNLRLARSLRKAGFAGKIVHYICPSVWAHGKGRIALMGKYFDCLLSILPFEKEHFKETALPVQYVGNPLTERISQSNPVPGLIALFPGSRSKELERNFPLYLRVAKKLQEEYPELTFAVSLASEKLRPLLEELMRKEDILLPLEADAEKLRSAASFAIAKSGTITLELALQEVPTVVTYGISPLDVFIVKYLLRIRLPFYCLVNILAKRGIFPELIGPAFSATSLHSAVKKFLDDPSTAAQCKAGCEEVRSLLGGKVASKEAAEHILRIASNLS